MRRKRIKKLAAEDLEEVGGVSREVILRRVGAQSMPPCCVRRIENPRLCNEV